MRCEYCDVEVTTYPENGICVCCGAKLPPKPAVPPVHTTVQPQTVPTPGANHCPKCNSPHIAPTIRGFSWGLGILGFFLVPFWGLLLGFLGRKSVRMKCTSCGRKWKP